MKFFPRHSSEESPKARALRMVLLVCVFGAVLWGFWHNSQRRLEELATREVLRDETGTLTRADRDALAARARLFKSRYGLALKVRVYRQAPALRPSGPGEVVLELAPERREVMLTLPPLVLRAVGRDAVRRVEDGFAPYFAAGAWQKGLFPALDALQTAIDEVSR